MPRLPGLMLAAALFALPLAGCGGSGSGETSDTPAPAPEQTAQAGGSSSPARDASEKASGGAGEQWPTTPAEAVTRKGGKAVVRMTGDDNMQYNIGKFTVRPGETVKLVFKHVGEQSVKAMGHNVVILKSSDASAISFSATCQSKGGKVKNDYLPKAVRERVLAHTDLVGGGEKDTVTFTAPEKPAKYPFLCTFPGHAPTMNGKMIVASP